MRKYKAHIGSGFTIVELLIVIVVIAILAAISVVAYNGIQQRAHNTQIVSAAAQWKKLISLYLTQNGGYASMRNGGHYCLGSGYPTNWDVDANEDCLKSTSIKHPSAAINNLLIGMGSLPAASPVINSGGVGFAGVTLRQSDVLDPTGQNTADYPTLWYYLEGNNQDCILRPVIKTVAGGIVIDTTASYSYNDTGTTVCRIALPDPSAIY